MSVNPCCVPCEQKDVDGDDRWMSIHKRFLQECSEKDPESMKKHVFLTKTTKSFFYANLILYFF